MTKLGLLAGGVVIVGGLVYYALGRLSAKAAEPSAFREVDAREFAQLVRRADAVILDVRTPREFNSGHLQGAVNIDVHGSDFLERVGSLPKDKTILVYCASGVRSARACSKMARMGFPQLVHLRGGISSWIKAGLPVQKPGGG